MNILVTGGAGYIGAHVVDLLQQRGDKVIVVDNLSTGVAEKIKDTKLYKLDISQDGATEELSNIMEKNNIEAVIHFAALKQVGESVEKPLTYYHTNLTGMINLLTAMKNANVKKLVFSSSAATYGMPDVAVVTEDYNCSPINPYGETKLIGEWMANASGSANDLRVANLRYFNVAGAASPELMDTAALNLVPMVFERLEKGEKPKLFGDDYETEDGTCIRDYVHVADLADAHLAALDYLDNNDREFNTFNVGTGKGSSVKEVLDTITDVTGIDTTPEIEKRRAGDPPHLIADVSRINDTLGWKAQHNLNDIITSTWEAMKANGTPLAQEN
ncbi:MAG: UDP-glucose 4-epimerase GalE [Micrococcaceae bacterium]